MEAIRPTIALEESRVALEVDRLSVDEKETSERFLDHYDEPNYFFRGAIFGFLLCLPLWAIIIWLVT